MDYCDKAPKNGKRPIENCGQVQILLERNRIDPNGANYIDVMPLLVREGIFGHLDLEQQINCANEDEEYRDTITGLRTRHMCYTDLEIDYMYQSNLHASGSFRPNYVQIHDFSSIVEKYGGNLLKNLRFLHLIDAKFSYKQHRYRDSLLNEINSFKQLEELKIVRCSYRKDIPKATKLHNSELYSTLNLPVLTKFHIEDAVGGIQILTLETPRLRSLVVKEEFGNSRLQISYPSVIRKLAIPYLNVLISRTETKPRSTVNLGEFTSLTHLHILESSKIDENIELLTGLPALAEIHLQSSNTARLVLQANFRRNQRPLVYYYGLRVENAEDSILNAVPDDSEENYGMIGANIFERLIGLPSDVYQNDRDGRLATEIPLYHTVEFAEAGRTDREKWTNVLSRLTDLESLEVETHGKSQEVFRQILDDSPHVKSLIFKGKLADANRLFSNRCNSLKKIQRLAIERNENETTIGYSPDPKLENLDFLSKFSNLLSLELYGQFEAINPDKIENFIRTLFDQHRFLMCFEASYYKANQQIGLNNNLLPDKFILIQTSTPCKQQTKHYRCFISGELIVEPTENLNTLIKTLVTKLNQL